MFDKEDKRFVETSAAIYRETQKTGTFLKNPTKIEEIEQQKIN